MFKFVKIVRLLRVLKLGRILIKIEGIYKIIIDFRDIFNRINTLSNNLISKNNCNDIMYSSLDSMYLEYSRICG